jgi:hypothetical protein
MFIQNFNLFAKRLEIFLINEKTRTHVLYKNLKLTLFSQKKNKMLRFDFIYRHKKYTSSILN